MYRVWFDRDTCLIVDAPDEEAARLKAQFMACDVTGRWYHPTKVEPYK
jgi:hypothetical protein